MTFKLFAVAALSLGMATSVMAQSGNTNQSGGSGGNTLNPPVSDKTTPSTMPKTDSTTTNSTMGGSATGSANPGGLSGNSAAGTNEKCPAGTPGAGVNSAPKNDTAAVNPACN